MRSDSSPPPWQVLALVANHLDPKTLATASCVSKSWFHCMSSDNIWEPICSSLFPTLSPLRLLPGPPLPWSKLYALGHVSAMLRFPRRLEPRLSLENLVFTVQVRAGSSCVFTVVKAGCELSPDSGGVFWFEFEVASKEEVLEIGGGGDVDGLKVTWIVVLEGFKGVFTMMDCEGKGTLLGGVDWWFSEELPPASCCLGGGAGSGLVGDLRLGLRGREDGKLVVNRIGLGVMSIGSWRYVSIDDALRYLQHFLIPCRL